MKVFSPLELWIDFFCFQLLFTSNFVLRVHIYGHTSMLDLCTRISLCGCIDVSAMCSVVTQKRPSEE